MRLLRKSRRLLQLHVGATLMVARPPGVWPSSTSEARGTRTRATYTEQLPEEGNQVVGLLSCKVRAMASKRGRVTSVDLPR